MLLDDPTRPLRTVLLDDYLIPTARWLLGPPQQPYLLPQAANSNWECALSIWYLADLSEELDPTDPLIAQIEAKVPQTARWIVSQARSAGDAANWEGVTWDTAVCIRAVMRAFSQFESSFSATEAARIRSVCVEATRWLVRQFLSWDTEVIYPFGPADVAQILVTLLYLRANAPDQLKEAAQGLDSRDGSGVIEEIARYLVAARDDIPLPSNPAQAAAFWGDFFQSGEVIECLASYVTDCRERKEDEAWATECRTHVVSCIRYMETNQVDGKWGTHSDTCRALYAYLRTSHLLGDVGQEHHVVLKALRWMCDEKQTFSDGSFMHTTFLTVFYSLALWEAYKDWSLGAMPVVKAYDQALWSAPVRATPERGLRLKLQVDNERLERENQQHVHALATWRRLVISSVVTLGILIAGFVVALVTGLLSLTPGVEDPNTFLVYVGVVAVVAVAVAGFLYRGTK